MSFCKRSLTVRFWALVALIFVPTVLSACGDSTSSRSDAAATIDGGVCGTSSNPGILKITDVLPVTGSTVTNGGITHSFTVPNAPAQFTAFTMRYGSNHTAGGATPEIAVHGAPVGTSMVYTFTVNSWSIVPGHVELKASAGYQTKEGCAWVFPTPILSYDVIPDAGLDGGVDGKATSDAAGIDAPMIDAADVDAPLATDAAMDLAGVDAPASDVPAIDGLTVDLTTVDLGRLDAGTP